MIEDIWDSLVKRYLTEINICMKLAQYENIQHFPPDFAWDRFLDMEFLYEYLVKPANVISTMEKPKAHCSSTPDLDISNLMSDEKVLELLYDEVPEFIQEEVVAAEIPEIPETPEPDAAERSSKTSNEEYRATTSNEQTLKPLMPSIRKTARFIKKNLDSTEMLKFRRFATMLKKEFVKINEDYRVECYLEMVNKLNEFRKKE